MAVVLVAGVVLGLEGGGGRGGRALRTGTGSAGAICGVMVGGVDDTGVFG